MTRKRRRRPVNPATAAYWIISFVVLVYVVAAPLAANFLNLSDDGMNAIGMDLFVVIQYRAMIAFFIGWIFFFGAALGSFLNVVAFRMPRGESIVTRGSRCPYCETAIESRDNIPVFGWLGLRGRCRACRLPISKRYPIVELICGLIFLWLAGFELLSGGANLPEPQPFRRPGLAFVVFAPDWPLIATTLSHGALSCMLLVWCLLEIDGAKTPKKFVAFGWAAAAASALLISRFPPTSWLSPRPEWLPAVSWLSIECESAFAGLVVGAVCGWLLTERSATTARRRNAALVAAGSVIGAMLGWQAAFSVATLTAIGLTAAKSAGYWQPLRFPFLLSAVLLQIALWKLLDAASFWPGEQASFFAWTGAAIIIAVQWLVVVKQPHAPKALAVADRES